MKINFQNLGPLNEGSIELKKLTIIAGGNNTGKTYLTYTLYGLLTHFQQWCEISFLTRERSVELVTTGRVSTFCNYEQLSEALNKCSQNYAADSLSRLFSAREDFFRNTVINVIHNEDEFSKVSPINVSSKVRLRNIEINIEIKTSTKQKGWDFVFTTSTVTTNDHIFSSLSFLRSINRAITRNFLGFVLPTPWISTSERLGIALFYRDLDSNRNALVEHLQNMSAKKAGKPFFDPFEWVEKATSRFAIPIHENINFVRNLDDIKENKSELDIDLSRYISMMMGGNYKFQHDEIVFTNNRRGLNRLEFPLHLGSSSLRSLADIYFYLHHLVTKNSLLIIDEPESHLTPQNQVVFARMIGACISAGVRVVITTHSDYILKEINNLIMLHSINNREKIDDLNKRYNYTENESIAYDDVIVYLCNNNKVSECKVDKFGIEVPNIDEAIESMNTRASHLYDILDR